MTRGVDNGRMESLNLMLDFILHVDQYLAIFVNDHGYWVYALLFCIVFIETGLVIMPFLPGDSLLFVVGALSGADLISFPISCLVLLVAAILGDQCNYSIGRFFGTKVFKWENSRLFNKVAFDQAHQFYETYGGITIVVARFMPFVRTFAPFVAGVANMNRSKFIIFNVLGAFIWVLGIVTIGYFLGSVPLVKTHLDKIIWAMILLPGLLVIWSSFLVKKSHEKN